jgi:hypothetical protein
MTTEKDVYVENIEPGRPVFELTAEQMERIKRYKAVLAEVEPSPLEEAVGSFCRDHHPDREIAIWEGIAGIYQAEVELRPQADKRERQLLFTVILQCSLAASLTHIAQAVPDANDLSYLGRVLQRFQVGIGT